MAKSFIGLAEGQEVRGIYASWEPYNKNTAQVLLEHYQNLSKIKELIVLGNILFLERDIKDIQKPIGDTSEETVFQSISSAVKNSWALDHAEYCYIYHDGSWLGFTSIPEKNYIFHQRMEEIPEAPEPYQSDYSYIYDYFLKE
jgi:hypothetical protein